MKLFLDKDLAKPIWASSEPAAIGELFQLGVVSKSQCSHTGQW